MERSKQENQGHQETLTDIIITDIPPRYTVSNFFLLSIREPVMPAAHINACIVVIIMKWSMNEKHEQKHWNPLHTTSVLAYHHIMLLSHTFLLSASSVEPVIPDAHINVVKMKHEWEAWTETLKSMCPVINWRAQNQSGPIITQNQVLEIAWIVQKCNKTYTHTIWACGQKFLILSSFWNAF